MRAPVWRLALAASAVAACLAVLPAQALELSASAAVDERNASAQQVGAAGVSSASTATVAAGRASAAADLLEDTAAAQSPATPAVEPQPAVQERGGASWYARYFHGRRTANGERYDQNQLTAAHKTLPFGTVVRVRSEVNGKEVDVRINDRGPFVAGRVIDLSQAAARALDMLQTGVKRVTLLLPPRLRPAEASASNNKPSGGAPLPGNSALPFAPADAPAARTFTPNVK